VKNLARVRGWWESISASDFDVDSVIRTHRPDVYRLALSMGASPDVAEDIAQEVCCRLFQSRAALESANHRWPWIRKVTVRCAVTVLTNRTASPLDPEFSAPSSDPNESLAVSQVLSQLTVEHRLVLALSLYEGLSYKEIAEILDVPMGSVASRIHYAKERFRALWEADS
jgi:RNA polymerase sigma-70 factor (ECF subfamily)